MNIIEFLKNDHQEYEKELTGIRRGLREVGLAGVKLQANLTHQLQI